MIGSLVGAGLSAVGSIFGGISASKAMKKVKKNLQAQKQANQDWYDRRYNEDATQRADAQRILTKTEESIRNRNQQAAGAQAVMGGTEESVAAAKAANNQALAGAICSIVAVILRVVSVPFIMGFAVFDTTADAANNAAKSIMEQSNSNEK